jgi:hypothetical protein
LHSKTQCRINRFFHGAPESDSAFELRRNIFGYKLGISFRSTNFLDIYETGSFKLFFEIFFKPSISVPFLPITIPGRAVKSFTFTFSLSVR